MAAALFFQSPRREDSYLSLADAHFSASIPNPRHGPLHIFICFKARRVYLILPAHSGHASVRPASQSGLLAGMYRSNNCSSNIMAACFWTLCVKLEVFSIHLILESSCRNFCVLGLG